MKKNMIYAVMSASLLLSSQAQGMMWSEVLQEKQHLFDQHQELSIIKEQHAAFACGQAPAIANPVIKSIAINENGEELVDVRAMGNPRITMMPNPTRAFENDASNSGLPSAAKMRKTVYAKLATMVPNLDELAPEFGYTSHQVSIKVFEGLRDLETQATLFGNKKAEIMAADSKLTNEEADAETSKWVSPVKNNVPVHSTGAAVDIRLWNETTQDFLDLGKFGVIWGENKSVPTFSEDITSIQKRNRLYLLMAASKAGLTNYAYEYWHLSSGDRYAAYWQEKDADKRVALYGSVLS